MLLFISTPEVLFVMVIVVMIFGADKVPEIARGLGKGMRELKDATNDIKKEITNSAEKSGIMDKELTKDIKNQIDEVKDSIEEVTGPIKRRH
ncbi:sec-independent protein translocase protein TatA [Pustulibacterium marinum]|uniref:Sec-independent protein translocase protein TatA n=1 Tax=Pustulibacterium marinum TaxID=1224947 RepID=A0A1I7FVJ9_9FLAO|nr:twin-arginine translocase TatA/TatE family subunit [Pustulibacterium marinum]SFU40208.1 sec-independent protein translocase protein TatA [Pustulibacterium marinum]